MNYKYLNDDTLKCGSTLFKSPNIPYTECPTPDPLSNHVFLYFRRGCTM